MVTSLFIKGVMLHPSSIIQLKTNFFSAKKIREMTVLLSNSFPFLKKFRENKKHVILFFLLFPLLFKNFVKILFILRKSRENTKHDNTLLLSFCVLQKFRENNESSIYFFFLFCKNIREIVFFAFFAIISLNHWLFKIFLL